MTKAEQLISAQDNFWTMYKKWIQERLISVLEDGSGLRKWRTIFPAIVDHHDRTFNHQLDAVRNQTWDHLVCHNPNARLNPKNIVGLSQLWQEINRTLGQVGSASCNYQDKESVSLKVLSEDIENLTKDLDVQRIGMSSGTRDAVIF